MRINQHGLVIGYHGTSIEVAEKVINAKGSLHLSTSVKDYDWLGSGIYFWENSQRRAEAWANERHPKSPTVIGAVMQMGSCFDLLDQKFCDLADIAAKAMADDFASKGEALPVNMGKAHRYDCSLMEFLKFGQQEVYGGPYDSARAAFMEGDQIAGMSDFRHQTHIQIAIFNPNCIKGYFWPQVVSLETSSVSSVEG